MDIYIMSDAKSIKASKARGIYVLSTETSKGEASRGEEMDIEATRNNAEIIILVEAIKRITKPCDVRIFVENGYTYQGLHDWMSKWEAAGWKNAKGDEIANREEWQQIAEFVKVHRCTYFLQCHHSYRAWMKDVLKPRRRYE